MSELLARVEVECLIGSLRARRTLALLGPRLAPLAPPGADAALEAASAAALRDGRRQADAISLTTELVRERLTLAGIRASVLKGPALAERLHGERGARISSDIDLLLAREQLSEAARALETLGYLRLDEQGSPVLHLTLTDHRGALAPVELHWRIHWYEEEFAADRLLAPSPAPEDELAALLLFYARDGFRSVRHAADIAAWWDRHGHHSAPGVVGATAARYPALAPALAAAAGAAEHAVGVPSAHLLGAKTGAGVRTRIAMRVARTPAPSRAAQIHADMALVDRLLAPRRMNARDGRPRLTARSLLTLARLAATP